MQVAVTPESWPTRLSHGASPALAMRLADPGQDQMWCVVLGRCGAPFDLVGGGHQRRLADGVKQTQGRDDALYYLRKWLTKKDSSLGGDLAIPTTTWNLDNEQMACDREGPSIKTPRQQTWRRVAQPRHPAADGQWRSFSSLHCQRFAPTSSVLTLQVRFLTIPPSRPRPLCLETNSCCRRSRYLSRADLCPRRDNEPRQQDLFRPLYEVSLPNHCFPFPHHWLLSFALTTLFLLIFHWLSYTARLRHPPLSVSPLPFLYAYMHYFPYLPVLQAKATSIYLLFASSDPPSPSPHLFLSPPPRLSPFLS
jgi:hypothetical protein